MANFCLELGPEVATTEVGWDHAAIFTSN